MDVTFEFFDQEFDKHGYSWECDLPCVPGVGHEVHLPGLDGVGYLRQGKSTAEMAAVFAVTWHIEDDPCVVVFCEITWENPTPATTPPG